MLLTQQQTNRILQSPVLMGGVEVIIVGKRYNREIQLDFVSINRGLFLFRFVFQTNFTLTILN